MARTVKLVVVGASAGGLVALERFLSAIPPSFTAPIAIVQHLGKDAKTSLAALLAQKTGREVREAEDKDPILPSTVYLAPANYHLSVEREGIFSLSVDEEVNFSRPSIDVLFLSAAEAWGEGVAGVVLSGANHDGASGLLAIRQGGGATFVQDPDDAAFHVMPAAALQKTAVDFVGSPDAIARYLAVGMVAGRAEEEPA